MSDVFDQINPTNEPETTDTATTSTETTDVPVNESTETTATETNDIKPDDEAGIDVQISGVYKGKIDGRKIDKESIDVVLVRTEATGGTAIVFYQDTMEFKEMPASVGPVKSRLADGGLVTAVKGGKVQRTYATLHLTLADLANKIAALPADAWQPRTKHYEN